MSTRARFTDYQAAYARQHADELNPAEDARLFAEPDPIDDSAERIEEIKKNIAKVQRATCEAYATMGLPVRLRPLVDIIIAASNGKTVFTASYKRLVELLHRKGDGRTFNAKKCEVRNALRALRKWQEDKNNPKLCTIKPGGKTADAEGNDEYHDTEFELVLLDALAKALARNSDPEKMRAVVRQEIFDRMRKVAPFDARWQVKTPSLDEVRERDRKAAIYKAVKAALITAVDLHGDPEEYLEAMVEVMREAARRAPEKQAELQALRKYTPEEVRELAVRRAIDEVQTSGRDEVEAAASVENTELDDEGVCHFRHTPPTHSEAVGTAPDIPVAAVSAANEAGGEEAEIAPKEKKYKVINPDALLLPERSQQPTAADADAFDRVVAQLRPVQVSSVEVPTRELPANAQPGGEHTCPAPDVEADEIKERVAVICEMRNIAEDDYQGRAAAAAQARRDLCERCHAPP